MTERPGVEGGSGSGGSGIGGPGHGLPRVDVERPRSDAARMYDRLSRVYDFTEGLFERGAQNAGLRMLAAQPGEQILEVGYGTGRCLAVIAQSVGTDGRVAGVDISEGMHQVASRRVQRLHLAKRVDLRVGDALHLPFQDGSYDAIFTSFCLELFSTADIPILIGECRRVLRPDGRMVVVSLASTDRPNLAERAYIWAHNRFPRLVDCRPIPLEVLLDQAGFGRIDSERRSLFGLLTAIVRARPQSSGV
jgi:ubiquinone/menaquinone biosynthesis C-methylase UbiE